MSQTKPNPREVSRTIRFPEVELRLMTDSMKSHDQVLRTCLTRQREKDLYDPDTHHILSTNTRETQCCLPRFGNGLLGTMYHAYSQHIPLSLRPDDLWIAILVNFGRYIQTHTEQVRQIFVDHPGKKKLEIETNVPMAQYLTPAQWEQLISQMSQEIQKNVKTDLVKWIIPTFSTTTPTDVMVAQVALMSACREFFDYCLKLSCGLPQVTLQGTLEDWQNLVSKVTGLQQFGLPVLDQWSQLLLPVLQQLILTYQGQVDSKFWATMCTSQPYGSGSQRSFRGWFLVFGAFNEKGEYLLSSAERVAQEGVYGDVADVDLPDCGLSVDVSIHDHGQHLDTVFYTGVILTEYDEVRNVMSPSVDWMIIQKQPMTYEVLLKKLHQRETDLKKDDPVRHHGEAVLKEAYEIVSQTPVSDRHLVCLVNFVFTYCNHYLTRPEGIRYWLGMWGFIPKLKI